MPPQHYTNFLDIAQKKFRAKIEQKDKIISNNYMWSMEYDLYNN